MPSRSPAPDLPDEIQDAEDLAPVTDHLTVARLPPAQHAVPVDTNVDRNATLRSSSCTPYARMAVRWMSLSSGNDTPRDSANAW